MTPAGETSTSDSSSSAVVVVDLNLGDGSHPRRIVSLPSFASSSSSSSSSADAPAVSCDVVAYGGDDGTVTALTSSSSSSTTKTKIDAIETRRARPPFDEPIRCVASSNDGRRVAIGFEDGSTRVFCYDDSPPDDDGRRKFVLPPRRGKEGEEGEEKDEDDAVGDFLSQDDGPITQDPFDDDPNSPSSFSFAGPRFGAPLRSMSFDPRCSNQPNGPYYLAVASEEGFCVVDVATAESLSTAGRLLESDGAREHDSCGVRGVSHASLPSSGKTMLATLAMDGRLCVWDVSSLSDPNVEWDLVWRDRHRVVGKNDVGEYNGSDACDRSCLPVWGPPVVATDVIDGGKKKKEEVAYLALPGSVDLQLRRSTDVGKELFATRPDGEGGHKDSIVSIAFGPDGRFVATGGRDGRIALWELNYDFFDATSPSSSENDDDSSESPPPPGRFVKLISGPHGSAPTDILWERRRRATTNDDDGEDAAEEEVFLAAFADGTALTLNPKDFASAPSKTSSSSAATKGATTAREGDGVVVVVAKGGAESSEENETVTTTAAKESARSSNDDEAEEKGGKGNKEEEGGLVPPPEVDRRSSVPPPPIEEEETRKQKKTKKHRLHKKAPACDDADDDDDVVFDEENAKHGDDDGPSPGDASAFLADEAEEADDGDGDADCDDAIVQEEDGPTPAPPSAEEAAKDREDDEIMETFESAAAGVGPEEARFDSFDDDRHGRRRALAAASASSSSSLPEPQPAFAPSSTPLLSDDDAETTRRILCWNHVGAATLTRESPTTNVIDVDFLDSAFRKPVSFTDNLNFILGSLGEQGALFATDVAEEDDDDDDLDDDGADGEDLHGLNISERTKAVVKRSARRRRRRRKGGRNDGSEAPTGSSVYFHRFETFGPRKDKDWFLTLPDGERALGCACGVGWAAVVTSRRYLRLYTTGGAQTAVSWLPGPPVTIVGRDRYLGVAYHASDPSPSDETQRLGCLLLDGTTGETLHGGPLSAIGPGGSLSWAGFDNEMSFVVMDDGGTLSMLVPDRVVSCSDSSPSSPHRGRGFSWVPTLDTAGHRKSDDDSNWPVAVRDGRLVCVPLGGGNEHPDASRRPVTTTIGLRLPLAAMGGGGGGSGKSAALEELSVRANLALSQKKFRNDVAAASSPDDAAYVDDLEAEYDKACAQVDKVTLKLFIATLESNQVERALDLIDRLHLEKSCDIAVTVSDKFGLTKLSDRIYSVKERRFPPPEDETDGDDEVLSDDGCRRERRATPSGAGEEERRAASRRISPDGKAGNRSSSSRTKRDRDDGSDVDDSTMSSPPRRRRVRSKDASDGGGEDDANDAGRSLGKRPRNPFAKRRVESPARPAKHSVAPSHDSPSSKPALARTSTFSAQSRLKSKGAKRIL